MCWGKLAERAHSFSARGKQKALGTAGFMLKPANIPSHWGLLARSLAENTWLGAEGLCLEKNCSVLCLSKSLWPGSRAGVLGHQGFSGGGAVWPGIDTESWLTAGFGFRNLKFTLFQAVNSWWLKIFYCWETMWTMNTLLINCLENLNLYNGFSHTK